MKTDLNAVLSAVVVVASVVIALLLSVKTYQGGGGLDAGWGGLLALVFGGALGVHKVREGRKEQGAAPPVQERAVEHEAG